MENMQTPLRKASRFSHDSNQEATCCEESVLPPNNSIFFFICIYIFYNFFIFVFVTSFWYCICVCVCMYIYIHIVLNVMVICVVSNIWIKITVFFPAQGVIQARTATVCKTVNILCNILQASHSHTYNTLTYTQQFNPQPKAFIVLHIQGWRSFWTPRCVPHVGKIL